MTNQCLHITNGNNLTDYIKELGYNEPCLTWQEMLCEGPTIPAINSNNFFDLRKDFLKSEYGITPEQYSLTDELQVLNDLDHITEINLWFEYDLFCHINLLGTINLLHQKEIDKPLFLICSGRVKGEKQLRGLSELSPEQLNEHYKDRICLTQEDKELAIALWRTYCGKDHNILKPYIVQNSSFKYLSNCLKAHLERFPNQKTGLDRLEENILKLVKDKEIKSKHHLLGYALNYQGFYGFGDIQLERIIDKLSLFFEETKDKGLRLNRLGHNALLGEHNVAKQVNNAIVYGGVNRLQFQFNTVKNRLVKTIAHVD